MTRDLHSDQPGRSRGLACLRLEFSLTKAVDQLAQAAPKITLIVRFQKKSLQDIDGRATILCRPWGLPAGGQGLSKIRVPNLTQIGSSRLQNRPITDSCCVLSGQVLQWQCEDLRNPGSEQGTLIMSVHARMLIMSLMQESVSIKNCVKQIGQAVKSSSESAIAFWHLTRF
jgi:hypothetical protein